MHTLSHHFAEFNTTIRHVVQPENNQFQDFNDKYSNTSTKSYGI
jgi:hypothetical protein